MAELERDLRALAAHLEWPETPSLAPRVRVRLREPAPRGRRPWRLVAVALAVLAIAIGLAFAVPQSRGSILRWLGLRGVRIEFVDRLPKVPPAGPLDLGPRVSVEEASRRAGFHVLMSKLLGSPDEVHFDGVQVWLVYGDPASPRALLSEFRGRAEQVYVKKVMTPKTRVDFVSIAGQPGYFLSGAEHFLYIAPSTLIREERLRLARNTLVWQHGLLTLRLEGGFGEGPALQIARSLK
jgi:hypothetical protein